MVQRVIAGSEGRFRELELPDPAAVVWPGLSWRQFDEPLTPAFWASQAWMWAPESDKDYRLGSSLAEEVVFCLLGGYGAPAEVGLAASRRVCAALSSRRSPTMVQSDLELLLSEPLIVGGRPVRYRFAAQRARYLAGALSRLSMLDENSLEDVALRDALWSLPGIGPKTASWIVRNRRASDCVAILDVHIVRACAIMGVFPMEGDPTRRYHDLEKRFLRFCEATRSRASAMDAVMWATMRRLSRAFLQQLVDRSSRFAQLAVEQRGNRRCQDRTVRETTSRAQVVPS